MTVPISTIVNVSITLQARAITNAGFGVPMIMGDSASGWSERVRSYISLAEVGTDFLTTDAEYLAAQAIFSQSPKVPLIKIGQESARVAQIQTIVFSANLITGNSIAVSVDGVALSAVPFNTSNAQTLTDFATALQATAGIATAVSNGTDTITCTSATAGVPTLISTPLVTSGASQATAVVATTTANHGVAEDLAEISEEDNDWYGLIMVENTLAFVKLAAAYIETVRKIFITRSSDANILDSTSTTDVSAVLNALSYTRTAVIYLSDSTLYPDAAWMGKVFPIDPGQDNWKFKTLVGIVADELTSTERSGATGKQANLYYNAGGVDITAEGTMVDGAPYFIDVTRSIDWVQAQIEEGVFELLVTANKVPYTDPGIALIENKVREALERGESQGVIAIDPKYIVSVPTASSVSTADRTNRILNDVTFDFQLAGAINFVNVQGTVTV